MSNQYYPRTAYVYFSSIDPERHLPTADDARAYDRARVGVIVSDIMVVGVDAKTRAEGEAVARALRYLAEEADAAMRVIRDVA